MCLWCCWKDLDKQDLMEFIWIQNVGDIDFEVISNKFQKAQVFGEKISSKTW
jgi:hypothetical protein